VKEAAGDLPPVIDRNQIKLVLENLDKPCPLCDNPHIGETGRQHLENLLTQISVSSKTSNYLKESVLLAKPAKTAHSLNFHCAIPHISALTPLIIEMTYNCLTLP
jgi:DNA repair exonuclease SbcCD ATPase subunit